MTITLLPTPLLFAGALLLALLVLATVCSPAAAQRIVTLLESLQNLIHGSCQYCGRERKSFRRHSRRARKG